MNARPVTGLARIDVADSNNPARIHQPRLDAQPRAACSIPQPATVKGLFEGFDAQVCEQAVSSFTLRTDHIEGAKTARILVSQQLLSAVAVEPAAPMLMFQPRRISLIRDEESTAHPEVYEQGSAVARRIMEVDQQVLGSAPHGADRRPRKPGQPLPWNGVT